ncbi:MAG: hypothetical protein LH610_08430 [Sphingomonas bacterium]|nr:hypothetical protein [Sphingomonas bacterium]
MSDNALDQCAFGQASAAMVAEDREVDQHIAVALVADQESEATRRVEPFDPSGNPNPVAIVMQVMIVGAAINRAVKAGAVSAGQFVLGFFVVRPEDGMRDNGFSIC